MKQPIFILFFTLIAAGCTRPQYTDQNHVPFIIANRIDKQVYWNQSCFKDPCVTAYLQELINEPLTSESVVQIALLNNPQIQILFEELGIAQADLVEAGLLSNPAFEIDVRYPHQKKLRTNIEYLITATFIDIFLIPLRTRLAAAELEQAKRRVTHEILDLAFEVRQTYYELLAEQEKLKYTQSIVDLISIHQEITARQSKVGNVILLDFQQVQARFLETQLELAKSQSEMIRLKEKLNRLLGFSEDMCMSLPEELPKELNYQEFDLCALESLALEQRMDRQVARYEVIRLSRMLGIKEWWTYTHLQVGVAGERDPDGLNLVGFGMKGEVPIFNSGQAARMRIFAQLRQARDRLVSLEIRILSEVREAYHLLTNDLGIIIDYRNKILPIQSKILNSSEELYNVMGLGIDRLLENKRQELEAYRNYIESLKNFWLDRVQLDKSVGGYLFLILPQDNCLEGVAE